MAIAIPFIHILTIMILMGSLISEHLILKPNIGREQIKSLAVIDMIYGISAGLVLISGLLRWFVYGKGVDYYLHNPLFHTKLTLFVVVGILSIFPTVRFLKWRKEVKAGTNPEIDQKTVKKLLIFIRIELLIVALIPLLAVMIARGYGV